VTVAAAAAGPGPAIVAFELTAVPSGPTEVRRLAVRNKCKYASPAASRWHSLAGWQADQSPAARHAAASATRTCGLRGLTPGFGGRLVVARRSPPAPPAGPDPASSIGAGPGCVQRAHSVLLFPTSCDRSHIVL
jgi:hypothetical protein